MWILYCIVSLLMVGYNLYKLNEDDVPFKIAKWHIYLAIFLGIFWPLEWVLMCVFCILSIIFLAFICPICELYLKAKRVKE